MFDANFFKLQVPPSRASVTCVKISDMSTKNQDFESTFSRFRFIFRLRKIGSSSNCRLRLGLYTTLSNSRGHGCCYGNWYTFKSGGGVGWGSLEFCPTNFCLVSASLMSLGACSPQVDQHGSLVVQSWLMPRLLCIINTLPSNILIIPFYLANVCESSIDVHRR